MKRSLTQTQIPNLSTASASAAEGSAKTGVGETARRAGTAALGLAAVSVGATAGMFLPIQGEEALAAESSALNQPLIQHRIQDGDTLWGLSLSYGVPAEAIAISNEIQDGELLPVGETLQIPAPTREVQSSEEPQSAEEVVLTEDPEVVDEPQIIAAAPADAVERPETVVDAVQKDEEKTELSTAEEPEIVAAVVDEPESRATEVRRLPEAAPQDANSQGATVHHVEPGETFVALAEQYNVTVDALVELNGDVEPTQLQVGQAIVVPGTAVTSEPEATEPETPEVLAQSRTARSLSSSNAPSSEDHILRLKADVMRLREEIRSQNSPQQVAAQPTTTVRAPSPRQSPTSTPTVAPRTATPPAAATAPAATPVHPEWEARQRVNKPSRSSASEDLIAAAPVPTQGYNRLLQLPAGQTVEPQIPPLLEQEQYLPEDAQTFNGYIWPARGTLTSGYGPRWGRMHRGIDIAAPTGTPIHAAAPGVVISAGWNSGGFGNLVEIRHPDGSKTLYAHNSRILVRKGDRVTQGQQIALMGSTGFSTGPHLHFEIHPAGRGAVNPTAFLPRSR
ncbi:MAG: peptidoglycan DD-metalloendopeptidase family protein [Spirulinaceae cyanobacterium]